MRRAAILSALVLACAAPAAAADGRAFVLEKELVGSGSGAGVFRNSLTGSQRKFTVRFRGTRTREGLTLAEDIAYADGEKERHVWRFVRTGPDSYEGRRDDVIGVARGKVAGDTLKLSYDVQLNTGGSKARVRFDDTLILTAPGTVRNRATVSKFFLPVGTVDLSFRMRRR